MVADTTTPLLQLLLQGTGNNNNAWGQNLNDQVITLAEQAIAGATRINSTGGTVILTDDQARYATIVVGGALTSNLTIIVPTRPKQWRFINGASGTSVVLVKTATGPASNLPSGCTTLITCIDGGNDTVFRSDVNRVGELFFFAGSSPPYGAMECANDLKKRADFPDLFRAIGTTWGSSDSTDFRVPPGYDTGRYLRSRSPSFGVGTVQANQNKIHTHSASGTTNAQSNDHYHTGSGTTGSESHYHTHSISGTTSGISTGHTHAASGTTGVENQSHNHSYTGPNGTSQTPGGNFDISGAPITYGSGLNSVSHIHGFSISTGGQSNDHSHSFSASSSYEDVVHYHSFSFSTSGISANHTHSYSFVTSTGTADGSESRPESIVGILCIRY